MVIYEVNLTVQAEVVEAFRCWLASHIQEMLAIEGFLKASLMREIGDWTGERLVVHYHVASFAHLQRYLNKDAERMRQEGLQRFPKQFQASRRCLAPEALLLS